MIKNYASKSIFMYGLVVLIGIPLPASAAKPKHTSTQVEDTPVYRNVAPQKQSTAQDNALSVAADFAQRNGIRSCVKRIDQVHKFLIGKSPAGIFTFMPPEGNPDEQLFSTSIEVVQPNAVPAYASSSYSPGMTGCGAVYEAVTYRPTSCKTVAAKEYPNLKATNPLKKDIQILVGSQTMRVFLMPADKGCVVIKKELVY
jgi:hypothetical protein